MVKKGQTEDSFAFNDRRKKNLLPRTGVEPVTYGCLFVNQLQSTALPTELSRGVMLSSSKNTPL